MSQKIKGIDISKWQGKISVDSFKKAKKYGIEFVILRLGYTGSSSKKPTLDTVFEHNYANAIKAGLPVGVYYYSLATSTSKAKTEAKYCITHLKGKNIQYPVYIDVEDPKYQSKCSKSTLASVCNTFCKIISAAGYTPGVYASKSWFESKIGTIKETHTKWVAQYYSKCTYKGTYDMWQYSSKENVPGIAKNTDVSWAYRDFSGGEAPEPPKEPKGKTYGGPFPKLPGRGYFKRGDKGTQVKNLQKFLNWFGNYKLAVDGSYGPKTEAAQKKFQKACGLKQDGMFGEASLSKAKRVRK